MTDKNSPFFSIVIPTRQRHETLPFAMRTVLNQDFDDYELIVCDNCSSPETFEVVGSFNNKKIKYIRSEISLSMSDNWELAVSKASGEYVIVFGDDDGLVHNSLLTLYKIIKETGCQAIRWERAYYNWGNVPIVEEANNLTLPFKMRTGFLDGKNVIKKVVNFKASYMLLPMLYNSAISRNLIGRLKEISGRVFSSPVPDVYSGFAFAYLTDKYLSLGIPFSICGASAKSNGFAGYLPTNPISEDFKQLISKSEISYHKKIPFVRSMTSSIIESFLQLRDALDIKDIKVDMYRIMTQIIKEVRVYDDKELQESVDMIRKSCVHNPRLLRHVEHKLVEHPINIVSKKYKPYNIGLSGTSLILDASRFGIDNVFQVSEFVSNFYDYSANVFPSTIKGQTGIKSFIKRLYRRLRSSARILIKGE